MVSDFKAAGFSFDEEPQGLFAGCRPDDEVQNEAEAEDDDADPHKKNKLRPDYQVFDFAGRTLLTDVLVTFSRISQGSNVDAVVKRESLKIRKYGTAILAFFSDLWWWILSVVGGNMLFQ